MFQQDQNSITLTSPNGKRSITIRCNDDCAGIWVSNHETEKSCCLVDDTVGNWFGLYSKPTEQNCCKFAIILDDKDEPYVQVYKDGHLVQKELG